jgi:hypothetical protein
MFAFLGFGTQEIILLLFMLLILVPGLILLAVSISLAVSNRKVIAKLREDLNKLGEEIKKQKPMG